jgi:hypothetical protein
MKEMTPILLSMHTTNDNLHRRRVVFSEFNSIDSGFSEQGDMTELTPIMNSVHSSNDSLQRRGVPLNVVTSI